MATRRIPGKPDDVRTALEDSRTYLEQKHGDGNAVVLSSVAVADLLITLRRAQEAIP